VLLTDSSCTNQFVSLWACSTNSSCDGDATTPSDNVGAVVGTKDDHGGVVSRPLLAHFGASAHPWRRGGCRGLFIYTWAEPRGRQTQPDVCYGSRRSAREFRCLVGEEVSVEAVQHGNDGF
jgi:hypothetical protein